MGDRDPQPHARRPVGSGVCSECFKSAGLGGGTCAGAADILFSSLTVIIDENAVSWCFGPGFWRKSVALDEM